MRKIFGRALTLPLNSHLDLERLAATAGSHAAQRAGVAVVEADGEPRIVLACRNAIGGIEGYPADLVHQGFRPGVPGTVEAFTAIG